MLEAVVGAIFMSRGLGHLIGLNTHDVGGYAKGTPPRSDRPGLSKLKTAGILEARMVLTVEPGCYFIDILLDSAPEETQFFNQKRSESFSWWGEIGGQSSGDRIWLQKAIHLSSGCIEINGKMNGGAIG